MFSAGAWYHVVLPAVKYFSVVKEDNSCQIGEYNVKISGIKLGKDNNGKHVNTQIIFFADRDKIICHLYNTTQLILVNGHGYKKFIDLFLKPFSTAKISENLEEIEEYNDEVVKKLDTKTVRRSSFNLKRSPVHPCTGCEFTAKSWTMLRKHRKTEHVLQSFDNSRNIDVQKQSTRNNSIVENLMIEDATITDLTQETTTLDEPVLKYTCNECNIATKSQADINDHVQRKHANNPEEEVKFVCTKCPYEFSEQENYEKKHKKP